MSPEKLWGERVQAFWDTAFRYLRLIGNSGFMFALYILVLVGSYYYSTFLEWLPETFPVVFILAAVFSLLLTRSPVRTFLKEGDLVFLLPLEMRLRSYFRASVLYSAAFQTAGIVVLMVVLSPLFLDRISSDGSYWFYTVALLALAKLWNSACRWAEYRLQDTKTRDMHVWLRLIVNAVFTFLLFQAAPLYFTLIVLAAMVFVYKFYYEPLLSKHRVKWQQVLEMEERLLTTFYRMANMFTDVPHIKGTVKERRWISRWVDRLPYRRQSVFTFMYAKAFIRARDYFGIYIRLTTAAAVFIYASPNVWLAFGLLFLFIFMTGQQLLTLYFHFDTKALPDLYPLPHGLKRSSFLTLVEQLLLVQTVVSAVMLFVFHTAWLPFALGLLAGSGFTLWYVRQQLNTKLKLK
ncbi:ABC-2 type transport system permease protein [Salsuginibacillus halophilus]|uniref:ABC-2 type transport system permease protein n=1 Tax=Salsuginibacillus halophilus TaxID=517424 RepID=A0A2P8HG01_9BACI|nr:ABC transporter permease [Salsuginibacillus halophilus]PSL45151.1 ABC-2 type transport system permease protein [Salsuginibacillus halophilus]